MNVKSYVKMCQVSIFYGTHCIYYCSLYVYYYLLQLNVNFRHLTHVHGGIHNSAA